MPNPNAVFPLLQAELPEASGPVLPACPASGAALPRRCWSRWLGVVFGFWPPRMRRGFRWSWWAPWELYEAVLFLFPARAAPTSPARRNIVKANQIDLVSLTVLRDL